MAGNLIARAIVDGDNTWRLFLPFELIWAGGLPGRVAAQVGYWWNRRRDQSKAQKARDRAPDQAAPARQQAGTDHAASDASAAAAMAVPAIALPADAALDPPPIRMAEPPLTTDDGPTDSQRPSRRAMKASRSNR